MKERHKVNCAVFLILTKKEQNEEYILLQQRFNTGLLDGFFDVSCSGHLEASETVADAMIRETEEEIGLIIKKEDLKFSSTISANFEGREYLLITYSVEEFTGEPSIKEPDKCDKLEWFNIDKLPENMDETRKIMINNYKHKILYSEYGFDQLKK